MARRLLVVGASGLVGDALIRHFASQPNWQVVGLSRRPPHPAAGSCSHLKVDLADAQAVRRALASMGSFDLVVYAAVEEAPGLVKGWCDPRRMQRNLQLFAHVAEPLAASGRLGHLVLLQGAKAYGAHAGSMPPIPARESAPRDPHANFYWLQEDHLRTLAARHHFSFTIFRPQVVVGAASGSAMNALLAIAAYAVLCAFEDRPCGYPGGAAQLTELTDGELLAQACAWAVDSETAREEVFNITNGDIFCFRDAWPTLAELLGATPGPDAPLSLGDWLPARAAQWQTLARRCRLAEADLHVLLGQSHHYVDLLLRPWLGTMVRPTLLSTVKLRQAGFAQCRDSLDSLTHWLGELRRRRLIPQEPMHR